MYVTILLAMQGVLTVGILSRAASYYKDKRALKDLLESSHTLSYIRGGKF